MYPSVTAIERVAAPSADVLSLADAKAHMKVDTSDEDSLISAYVAAATSLIDGDGWLGRAMITQDWAQWVNQAPGWVRLSMGPFQELVSVQYYDVDNVLQTATLSDFETRKQGDFVICKPKEDFEWPAAETRQDAIKITYRAGWGDVATDVPPDLVAAIKLMTSHLYENRSATTEMKLQNIPMGVQALVGRHRVGWYG